LNAEALEGKQHVTYSGISEDDFQKIKACDFVADAGLSFHLGHTEDGTRFDYIDESFRDLSETVADSNIKQVISGHWAEKENEVVFTRNYLEKYGLELGDTISADLTATDEDTGDVAFRLPGLAFTIVGVLDNMTGFTDQKNGYVSAELAEEILRETDGQLTVLVRFTNQKKILEYYNELNGYLGFEEGGVKDLNAQINYMLAEAVEDGGTLKKQNTIMNLTIWLVCVLVVYNIFYNRLFERKRDFIALRKIGFQTKDLLNIMGAEFLFFVFAGFTAGILTGCLLNKIVYGEIMKAFVHAYDAAEMVSPELSWSSIRDTGIMFSLIIIPGLVSLILQLKNVMPAEVMRGKRKNVRKWLLALTIVSLSAILISILGIQDNHSDEGILYVKEYIPGDLQVTAGSIYENIAGGDIPSISDSTFQEMKAIPGIKQVQDYEINYSRGIFLCEEKEKLNADSANYESMLEMEQEIDGKDQCLYNLVLVTTDNLKALVPSYDEENDGPVAIMEMELAKTLNLEIGDNFMIYDEQLIGTGSKVGCVNACVKLLDVQNIMLSENHVGGNLLVVDRKTAQLFQGERYRQVVNVWIDEDAEANAVSDLEYISQSFGYTLRNAKQQTQAYIDLDHSQNVMHGFFIVVLAVIGSLIYFNTVFANLMNRRNDFAIMYKIGISKKEMYWKVFKEGLCHGCIATGITVITQAGLAISRQESFFMIFARVDAGVMAACAFFPVFILCYMFHRGMVPSVGKERKGGK